MTFDCWFVKFPRNDGALAPIVRGKKNDCVSLEALALVTLRAKEYLVFHGNWLQHFCFQVEYKDVVHILTIVEAAQDHDDALGLHATNGWVDSRWKLILKVIEQGPSCLGSRNIQPFNSCRPHASDKVQYIADEAGARVSAGFLLLGNALIVPYAALKVESRHT